MAQYRAIEGLGAYRRSRLGETTLPLARPLWWPKGALGVARALQQPLPSAVAPYVPDAVWRGWTARIDNELHRRTSRLWLYHLPVQLGVVVAAALAIPGAVGIANAVQAGGDDIPGSSITLVAIAGMALFCLVFFHMVVAGVVHNHQQRAKDEVGEWVNEVVAKEAAALPQQREQAQVYVSVCHCPNSQYEPYDMEDEPDWTVPAPGTAHFGRATEPVLHIAVGAPFQHPAYYTRTSDPVYDDEIVPVDDVSPPPPPPPLHWVYPAEVGKV